MRSSAKFINQNVPVSWNWRIGIPFGNDFKIIQMGRGCGHQYPRVIKLFNQILKNRKAHLFACGTINKIKLHGNYDFVKSFDASSVNFASIDGHYITYIDGKVVDPRALRRSFKNGKYHCSEKNSEKKRQILKEEGWDWKEWLAEKKITNKFKADLLIQTSINKKSSVFRKGYSNEYFRFKILLHNFKTGVLNFFASQATSNKLKIKKK